MVNWLILGVVLGLITPLAVVPGTLRKIYNEDGQWAAAKLYLILATISVIGMLFFTFVAANILLAD
ncbi:hypothetical protein [Blastochloris sulfoviridis]|uniref:Uncharacterized protein n=1 Tax=Blastochloris sulfoviridis TaxID=50712 RepID=A0A5M6I5U5_9HYPH|nr:hypothetical protein [Blastochloris sulfoviridis]KAA5603610.1 hypothetical protein F1193_00520 [Blastochloris sulfoviridis]